jgi:hypothetical protein
MFNLKSILLYTFDTWTNNQDQVAHVEIDVASIAEEGGDIHTLPGSWLDRNRQLPGTFSFAQNNILNPFYLTTQIDYGVPEAGPLSLIIYNNLDQSIRILIDGVQKSGYPQVTWDSREYSDQPVANGVYCYRLISDKSFPTVNKCR